MTAGVLDGLRVLVWCPHLNPGGGSRLLSRLAPAIAAHPGVALVRVAAQRELPALLPDEDPPAGNLEYFRLQQPGWQRWLARDGRIAWIKGTGVVKAAIRKLVLPHMRDWVRNQLRTAARDCDVVYVFWPHLVDFPAIDKPVVCTIQDTTLLEFPEVAVSLGAEDEWRRVEGWLRGAARVVVSSETTRDSLRRLFGPTHPSPVVIHHAISPIRPARTRATNQGVVGSLPPRYVLYPANTTEHKNHFNLLVAWSRFARRRLLPLVLCGLGTDTLDRRGQKWPMHPPSARLAGAVMRFGLEPGLDFFALGFVSDAEVAALLQDATALIMPSLAEGGGSYPVEEALSLGIPVLCSEIPVMREHLAFRSARIAWFDPYSPDSIVRALDSFFDGFDEYKVSAVRGASDVRPTWSEVGAAYADVLIETASNFGRQSGN